MDWLKVSTKELAVQLMGRQDLFSCCGFLNDTELYQLRCKLGVVICIDSAPVRKRSDGVIEVMAIKRKTGPYSGKFCLVGGIVKKGDSLEESIRSHFRVDLGVEIDFITPWDKPVCLHQYLRPLADGSFKKDFLPDPTKDHVVAPVYLVKLRSEKFTFGITSYGGQEVGDVGWFSSENMPPAEKFGYGHNVVFKKCLERAEELFLKNDPLIGSF